MLRVKEVYFEEEAILYGKFWFSFYFGFPIPLWIFFWFLISSYFPESILENLEILSLESFEWRTEFSELRAFRVWEVYDKAGPVLRGACFLIEWRDDFYFKGA